LGFIVVTHPHHPLCGQQVAVVRVRRGLDPDVIIRLPSGRHAAIAMSWTDYAAPPEPAADGTPPHLLALEGLLQVAALVAHLQERR